MVPQSEALTTSDSKEPMPKKPRRRTQQSVAKEALGVEASASAGSGGTGVEGRKKRKPESFCAASPGLTGVTVEHLMRNEQDTRTSCGVVFDIFIVPSQLKAVAAAKAHTQAYNDAVQQKGCGHGLGPPFTRTHHKRNEAGRGTGAALGAHGKVEQAVDRGEVLRVRHAVEQAMQTLQEASKNRDLELRWHENFKTGWMS